MAKMHEMSHKILQDNVAWLLHSDIRIKKGNNKGALYGWKDLEPPSFPFIYSEITGYAITCFSWIASELGNPDALAAAEDASDWIIKNIRSNLVVARPPAIKNELNALSNVFYSFDNGMIIIGLVNLYKITNNGRFLQYAESMTDKLIEHFFDGNKLTARLGSNLKPVASENNSNNTRIVKWSTVSGPYHCKLAMGFLELARLTKNQYYAEVSNLICNYAIKLQKPSGQFITNPGSDTVYLHPHLYACEGLVYSGLTQSNKSHYSAGLNGIRWAMKRLRADSTLGLKCDTRKNSCEQSDCTAQLLRLLILCRANLNKLISPSEIDTAIQSLHSRLIDFYIYSGGDKGGMRYQLDLNSACSWCTMFSMQALRLVMKRTSQNLAWIDYFI